MKYDTIDGLDKKISKLIMGNDNQTFSSFALVGPRTIEEIDSTLLCLDVNLSDDQIAWLNLQT